MSSSKSEATVSYIVTFRDPYGWTTRILVSDQETASRDDAIAVAARTPLISSDAHLVRVTTGEWP